MKVECTHGDSQQWAYVNATGQVGSQKWDVQTSRENDGTSLRVYFVDVILRRGNEHILYAIIKGIDKRL